MIVIDRDFLLDGAPDAQLLNAALKRHSDELTRLKELHDVHGCKHDIDSRRRMRGVPNNKLAHDLPGYIVTISAGYLVGNPVQYAPPEDEEEAFQPIADALKAACADSVDAELAVDAAVYGKGVEICYADSQARPRVAQVSPLDAFVVYDDTVEHLSLFGVMVCAVLDRTLDDKRRKERVTVYTAKEIITYTRSGTAIPVEMTREAHYFDGVPVTEYWNNVREEGDFERVMGLINAYDVLQSDRVNDKQQFTDSILALYGIYELSPREDGFDEDGGLLEPYSASGREQLTVEQKLRQTKTLYMPGNDTKAEWLTKPLAESDSEILRKSLKDDIHKFSMVPDMTDEHFAGTTSGVAMRYKLLGLEQLTKLKERWFREGLRQRLRLFSAFLAMRGAAVVDADAVQISFKRSLPVNELEIAQTVGMLDGFVPKEILMTQIPFVDDAQAAMEALKAEQAEAEARRAAIMNPAPFRDQKAQDSAETPPERDEA